MSERDRKKQAVKALKANFMISGDGVARRDMSQAVSSERFKKSAKALIEANLVTRDSA